MAISRIDGPCGWGLEVRLGRFGFAIGAGNIVPLIESWRVALEKARLALEKAIKEREG